MFKFDVNSFQKTFQWACSTWNVFLDATWGLLSQTPSEVSRDTWNLAMGSLSNCFLLIGISLLSIFFLIGYISQSFDLKEELDIKALGKLLFRLALVQGVFVFTVKLIPMFCNAAKALVLKIAGLGTLKNGHLSVASFDALPYGEVGFGEGLLYAVGGIVVLVVAAACGLVLLWLALGRVFKLFVLIPLSSLPLSTVAGGGSMAHSAVSWAKEFFIAVFEVVVMAVVLLLSSTFIGSNQLANYLQFDSGDAVGLILTTILTTCINIFLTVGAAKGAESTLRKAFGL